MFIRRFTLISLLLILIMAISQTAVAKSKLGSLLLLPIVPGEDIDRKQLKKVYRGFSASLKKRGVAKVFDIRDYSERHGKKAAKSITRCKLKLDCIAESLKSAEYDFAVVGSAEVTGKKWRVATFRMINLNKGVVVRTEKLRFKKGQFKSSRAKKWSEALFKDPSQLKKSRGEVGSPELVKREQLPSARDIRKGMSRGFELFAAGQSQEGLDLLVALEEKPCKCKADGEAKKLITKLEAYDKKRTSINRRIIKRSTDKLISDIKALQQSSVLLVSQGKKLQAGSLQKFRLEISALFGKAYAIIAAAQLRNTQYLKARDNFKKALEYDPGNSEAKWELGNMSKKYARSLVLRAGAEAMSDPAMAIKYLKQALQLAKPGSQIHQEAKQKLKEVRDEMN